MSLINFRLNVAFVCETNEEAASLASVLESQLIDMGCEVSKGTRTLKEQFKSYDILNSRIPHFTNEELEVVGLYCFWNKFGVYSIYTRDSLWKGKRPNVIVLSDNLIIDKEYFCDMIEPMASEDGDLILLSDFMECEEETKYTRQINKHFKQKYLSKVVDKFLK